MTSTSTGAARAQCTNCTKSTKWTKCSDVHEHGRSPPWAAPIFPWIEQPRQVGAALDAFAEAIAARR